MFEPYFQIMNGVVPFNILFYGVFGLNLIMDNSVIRGAFIKFKHSKEMLAIFIE